MCVQASSDCIASLVALICGFCGNAIHINTHTPDVDGDLLMEPQRPVFCMAGQSKGESVSLPEEQFGRSGAS